VGGLWALERAWQIFFRQSETRMLLTNHGTDIRKGLYLCRQYIFEKV